MRILFFQLALLLVPSLCFSYDFQRRPVPLKKLEKVYGLQRVQTDTTGRIILKGAGHQVVLMDGIDGCLIDGRWVDLGAKSSFRNGTFFVPAVLSKQFQKPRYAPVAPQGKFLVVIDAGHGGKDSGAVGVDRIQEKNIVLSVTKKVEQKLKQSKVRVVLTRKTDNYITLSERPAIANRLGANLFLSIHANAAKSRKARGIESFYVSTTYDDNSRARTMASKYNITKRFNGSSQKSGASGESEKDVFASLCFHSRVESRRFSRILRSRLKSTTHAVDRGIKEGRLAVLRWASCPAVLLELGFVSNTIEGRLLGSASYQEKLAETIARCIIEYARGASPSGTSL